MTNNKTTYFAILLVSTAFSMTIAADKAAAPEAAPVSPAEQKLEFIRDPFWPVGWQPKGWGIPQKKKDGKKSQHTELEQWDIVARMIKISGISKGSDGNYFVMIKKYGAFEQGDILSIEYGGLIYRWKIKKITKGGFVPQKLNATPVK